MITTYDVLDAAFRDSIRFPPERIYQQSIEPVFGKTFLSMGEPEHLTYRRLATPAFRSRAVEKFSATGLSELAHDLIDAIDPRNPFDLVREFTERFPYLSIARMLGVPRDMENQFHRWSVEILGYGKDAATSRAIAKALTQYLAPVVEERRKAPKDDVISELVHGEVDGRRLNPDEIFSHIRMLFPTGGETTHSSTGNALYALLTHDGAWEHVADNPSSIPSIVDETLRWEPPVAILPRLSAPTEVEFYGVTFPANSFVLFAIASANRDPSIFDRPDQFDLHRFRAPLAKDPQAPSTGARSRPREPLTFGRGSKSCPGLHLARKNMCVALEALAERLPNLRLIDFDAAAPRHVAPRSPAALPVCTH